MRFEVTIQIQKFEEEIEMKQRVKTSMDMILLVKHALEQGQIIGMKWIVIHS